MLLTIVSVLATSLLTLLFLSWYVRRTIPGLLNDVAVSAGEQISDHIKETFADPNVKKAFTILGQKSGDVRASDSLRNKVADRMLEGIPSIGLVLDQLDLTPVEGLQLLRDPIVGPFIQNFVQKGLSGLQNIGANPGNSPGPTTKTGNPYR